MAQGCGTVPRRGDQSPLITRRSAGSAYRRVIASGPGVVVRVDDVLTGGGVRRPAWRRRALIAAVMVVVAGLVVLRHLPGGQRAAVGREPPVVSVSEPLPRVMPGQAGVPGEAGVPGVTRPGPLSEIRLPVAGPRPFWFWPATGRAVPIGGLPVTGAGYTFVRAAGGWALTRGALARPACQGCAEAPLPVYFLASGGSRAQPVGTADGVAPAATAGRLWLTSYHPAGDAGTSVGTAREISAGGGRPGPAVRLPAGYAIDGATGRDLLLIPQAQRHGRAGFLLWNPVTGQASRRPGNVLAVSGPHIAWMPRCARQCAVTVADVATGAVITVRPPASQVAVSAAFSPDGRYLAVQVGPDFVVTGSGAATRLYLVNLSTGQVAAVPETPAGGGALVAYGWPAAADILVTELSFPGRIQLAAWRPGSGRPHVIALRPGQGAAALVLG